MAKMIMKYGGKEKPMKGKPMKIGGMKIGGMKIDGIDKPMDKPKMKKKM